MPLSMKNSVKTLRFFIYRISWYDIPWSRGGLSIPSRTTFFPAVRSIAAIHPESCLAVAGSPSGPTLAAGFKESPSHGSTNQVRGAALKATQIDEAVLRYRPMSRNLRIALLVDWSYSYECEILRGVAARRVSSRAHARGGT